MRQQHQKPKQQRQISRLLGAHEQAKQARRAQRAAKSQPWETLCPNAPPLIPLTQRPTQIQGAGEPAAAGGRAQAKAKLVTGRHQATEA
jgi:hypothetical protein